MNDEQLDSVAIKEPDCSDHVDEGQPGAKDPDHALAPDDKPASASGRTISPLSSLA